MTESVVVTTPYLGTPAQCDPDGENPCCSSSVYGKCGNTTKHCSCEHYTD